MSFRRRWFVTLAVCLTLPHVVAAQIVRGKVTESGSGAAIGGVLVSLVHAQTRAQIASVLTDPQGQYALRATDPGSYRVEAKRIGVRRYLSQPLTLAAGETQRLDIVVEGLVYQLPEIVVSGLATCSGAASDAPRIGALWEETRAALTATQISLRDRLFRGTISRYIRQLDPRTRRVLKEEGRLIEGVIDQPFVSINPESLSTYGYMRVDKNNEHVYHGPDAEVLLSDAFVNDHCFELARPSRARRGLAGISFAPVRSRRLSDIRGTMWLDERSFELRFVEFRYVNTQQVEDSLIGGEVHFAKLANGAWVVRKWFIRLPQGARVAAPVTVSGATPNVFVRQVGYTLREEGGEVTAQAMVGRQRRAGLVGTLSDSIGRPLAGAVVVLSGTQYKAVADAHGAFRLDGIMPGTFSVTVEHPGYLAYGMYAGEAEIDLPEGLVSQLHITAPRMREIRARLCPNTQPEYDKADLRVNLIDSAGRPAPRIWVRVSWNEVTQARINQNQFTQRASYVQTQTDNSGAVMFCGVPARTMLPISVLLGAELRPVRADSVRLDEREVRARDVRLP